MDRQQRIAIAILAVLSGGVTSVLVPLLMDYLKVESQLAWAILAPGVLMFPTMYHAEIVTLIMIVAFDGVLYVAASFIITHVILSRWPPADR